MPRRGEAAHGVAPLDVLDLDHLGAPVGEQRRGGGHEGVLGHLEDADALHDCGHRSPPGSIAHDVTPMLDGRRARTRSSTDAGRRSQKVDATVRYNVVLGPWLAPATSRCSTPTTTSTRPQDSFTRHLPEKYKGAIDYVEVRGRTKIAVRGTISEYIPNPTFEVVARPGAQEEYFRIGNPEGKSYRELIGEPMKAIPAFREPGAAHRADGRAGHRPHAHVPDPRQPARGADAGRSRT